MEEARLFLNSVSENVVSSEKSAGADEFSALSLAYLGDAVFELCVRAFLVKEYNSTVNKLHKKSKNLVSAVAQSEMYFKIQEHLTEKELAVLKRGRNAKSFTVAKNASVSDYRHATGLEALFGYLFLSGQNERIMELFRICVM